MDFYYVFFIIYWKKVIFKTKQKIPFNKTQKNTKTQKIL